MKTRQELLSYLASLNPHDDSLGVAVRELLQGAGEEGRTERKAFVRGIRESFQREGPASGDGGTVPGTDPGRLEAGALEPYLEEHVLARLEAAGIACRDPGPEEWDGVRISPGLWTQIQQGGQAYLKEVDRVVRNLQDRKVRETEVSAELAPDSLGSVLRGEELTKIYKKRKVVHDVDLSVEQGEIVGLLGPNGAGKTTSFYMIVGLIPPYEGRVFLDDREITRVPMYRRARMGIGYLAQEPSVFRKLTVEENVLAILETLDLSKKERKKRLEELLQELSISHLRDHVAYSLSGGERRRLEITRALVQRPKFMLLDEPFAGIDPIAVNDIQQIVSGLRHRGIGVIISDHNVEQTLEIVDRAYIMYEGRIRVQGTVSELVWSDEVAEIYLGPSLTQRMRKRYPRPEVTAV